MPRERLQERVNSSAENLIRSSESSIEHMANAFTNSAGPESASSSPPPSYDRVLEEILTDNGGRTAMLASESFDSLNEDFEGSIDDSDATSGTNFALSDCNQNQTTIERPGFEMGSEISIFVDSRDQSTAYDASSRQFDEDHSSLTTLRLDDENNESDVELRSPLVRKSIQEDKIIKVANKTSKQMYAALAKELGLSCRMSDQCRCADCQGGYLQCEDVEESGTDGGLGAGTPMFVSEVFEHGTAPGCNIL